MKNDDERKSVSQRMGINDEAGDEDGEMKMKMGKTQQLDNGDGTNNDQWLIFMPNESRLLQPKNQYKIIFWIVLDNFLRLFSTNLRRLWK